MSDLTEDMFEKEFNNLADKVEFSQFDSEDASKIDELKGNIIKSKFENKKKLTLLKRLEELEEKDAKNTNPQSAGSRRKKRKKSRRVKRKSRR